MKNDKQLEAILNIVPEDYKGNIKDIGIKASTFDGSLMVIFHLIRDQRLKFKKLVPFFTDDKIKSFYTEYQSKYFHIGGNTHLFDKINDYHYSVSPITPLKNAKQGILYQTVKTSCPKGTTRNAIIINTHGGLFPIHLSKLYNRLYCVDTKKDETADAKINLKLNRTNNCLLFTTDVNKWLKDFEGYKYTPPGRKHKIGLAVADVAFLNKDSVETLLKLEPETIILFSEREGDLNRMGSSIIASKNYEEKFRSAIEGFYIQKIKRKGSSEL